MRFNQAMNAAKHGVKVRRLIWDNMHVKANAADGAIVLYVDDEPKQRYESSLDDRVSKDWVEVSGNF